MSLTAITGVGAGRASLTQVERALAAALPGAVGAPPPATRRQAWAVRAVLVRAPHDTWSPLGVVIRPGRADDDAWDGGADVDLTLGDVRLVSQPLTAASLGGETDPGGGTEAPLVALRAVLAQVGSPRLEATWNPEPSGGVDVRRVAARNAWLDEPCWVAAWAISYFVDHGGREVSLPPIPRGRLFNAEHQLYFEDAGDAVAGWCRDAALGAAVALTSYAAPAYRVVVPDDRAYIAAVTRTAAGVDIFVGGTHTAHGSAAAADGGLFCVAVTTDLDDSSARAVLDVKAREVGGPGRLRPAPVFVASVRGGRSLASISLTLFDAAGAEYDHCVVRDLAAPVGTELLDGAGAHLRARSQTLDDARQRGESDAIEFKPFVTVARGRDGHDKAREILETLAAFANAGGGSLFLGVSDHGDVVGVAGGLAKEYGPVGRDAATPEAREQARRAAYAVDVRKLITEGIAPSLEPRFTWHTTAGLSVLQVEVPRGPRRPYAVADRQDVYVRHGATNARPTPAELRGLLSADG